VSAGLFTVSKDTKQLYLHWLDILFDKQLTFKWYISVTVAKVLTVTNTLRSLGNTAGRVALYLLRQAAVACIICKAYFGAEPDTVQGQARTQHYLPRTR
jgi:hypothetical protein